jgi:hypothetical protein
MHQAHRRDAWERTASVNHMIYMINRGKAPARPLVDFLPRDLRPRSSSAEKNAASFALAKQLFDKPQEAKKC